MLNPNELPGSWVLLALSKNWNTSLGYGEGSWKISWTMYPRSRLLNFFFSLTKLRLQTMLFPVERHIRSGICLYSSRNGDVQSRRGNLSEKPGRHHYFSQPQILRYQSFSFTFWMWNTVFSSLWKARNEAANVKEFKEKLQACVGIHKGKWMDIHHDFVLQLVAFLGSYVVSQTYTRSKCKLNGSKAGVTAGKRQN